MANVTILVAGGLGRRPSPREIGLLVPPEFRRRFRGRLIVHDAEGEDLVELGDDRQDGLLRISPALVETDLVVTVTAAESVLHGGPSALVRACSREVLRRVGRDVTARDVLVRGLGARRRARAAARRTRARSTASRSSSNLPHVYGGYPYDERSLERVAGSRLRRGLGVLPAELRRRIIERVPRELSAATVLGGTPSAAHSEALLRAIEFKGATLDEPLDAIVIGIPATTPFLPRGTPNPVSAAYLGLGLALRLWRNGFPVRPGGTAILLHDFHRRFPAPAQTPYRGAVLRPADRPRLGRAARSRAGRARGRRARSPSTAPAARSIRWSRSSRGARATRR